MMQLAALVDTRMQGFMDTTGDRAVHMHANSVNCNANPQPRVQDICLPINTPDLLPACCPCGTVQYMLEAEQLGPEQLGYDRPSSKLLAFMCRHYGLSHYVPQPNNVS